MSNSRSTSRTLITAVAGLALIAAGCSETPTEPELTLDELLSQLKIELTSKMGGESASAFGATPIRRAAVFEDEPSESQFHVVGPNLNVFNWPIIQDTDITAEWQGSTGETMRLSWPGGDFPTSVWPDLDVAGGTRFGNTWVIYPVGGDPNDWVAQHTEWIRRPGEQTGTVFPFEVKLEATAPCNECPIGQFIAGPSRHVTDQPEFRRRTVIKWFKYGDMSPWVWSGSSMPDVPQLEEAHVFITGFTTELEGGTVVTFENEIGDVDLLALRGQVREVVDSEVPRGTFTHVSFVIDPARSFVVVGGEQKVLNISAGTVRVDGPYVVGDAPITTVTLEFDPDASLTENADGSWTLAPVVVIRVTTG